MENDDMQGWAHQSELEYRQQLEERMQAHDRARREREAINYINQQRKMRSINNGRITSKTTRSAAK